MKLKKTHYSLFFPWLNILPLIDSNSSASFWDIIMVDIKTMGQMGLKILLFFMDQQNAQIKIQKLKIYLSG